MRNNKLQRHKAHEEIKKKIIFYEVRPGEKLSDKQIAAELGMGRTPVREALLILEREKLVQCNGKQGYFVKKLTSKEVNQYLEIRASLETFAIPLILQNTTPDLIKELKENIKKSQKCSEQGQLHDVTSYHADFHNIIYGATKSEVFIDIMSSLNDKFHWLRAIALRAHKGSPMEAFADHKKMVEAIENKDAKGLKKTIEMHLRHTQDKYNSVAALFL